MRNYILFLVFMLLGLVTRAQYGNLEDAPPLWNGPYEAGMNKVSHISFDYSGHVIGKGKSYFNSMGKPTQSLNWDPVNLKVWGQHVLYDRHGRAVFSTLSAPVTTSLSHGYVSNFILDSNNSTYNYADFDVGSYYNNPKTVGLNSILGAYYRSGNSAGPYQDLTPYPFSRTVYSHLNPGNVLKVLGGNKINGEWKQSYSFKMPAGTELKASWAFGSSYNSNTRVVKTVMRDVHGIETVVFTDGDGNTLAAARSGNEQGGNTNTYTNTLKIHKEQGYVDIHIPKGVNGFSISNPNSSASGSLKVYNLITEVQVYGSTSSLGPGFYRVAVSTPRAYSESTSSPITITHQVNYYDYSLNSYDLAGRLVSSKQPLNQLESTYQYNTLGELLSTTSPDEGSTGFIYRSDGQIRFSQNEKQVAAGEFSYTNYDNLARPIESGVCQESGAYMFNELSGTSNIHNGVTKEEVHTLYDRADTGLAGYLSSVGLSASNYPQTFVAGNVSKTWTAEPATNTTWYSYDVLGRLKWIIQKVEGLDKAQIIKYSYAPATGQVATIDYNPHISSDRFVHRYSYNTGGQLVKVETSTNGSTFQTQADYVYNDSGTLTRTVLAEDLQGIDYVYNINGQLKAINHPSLNPSNDPGQDGNGNGVAADVFGMSLDYYNGDYSRSNTPTPVAQQNTTGTDQYNGNIKGVRYRTDGFNGSGDFQSYMFNYNKNNWLAGATYGSGSISPILGNKHKVNFTANTNNDYQVSNLTYDANGNIQSLKRNGFTDVEGSNAMDDFTYHYNNGNQLQYVEDTGDNNDTQRYDDLKDQFTNGNPNYVYNAIGQLVTDVQKGVSYTYNASGLVTAIYHTDTGNPLVKFSYNDRGHRIKKEYIHNSGTSFNTYYVRDISGNVMAIYRGNPTQITENSVYGMSRIGVYKRPIGTGPDYYQYEITDHLGNVRAVLQEFNGSYMAVTKTDYYPGGMAMPNRNVQGGYRYGYQGEYAEKDEETGLNAFELRMYDSRINRWISPDPYGQYDSPYLAMGNNWINKVDPDGGCDDPSCMPVIQLDEVVITASRGGSNSWSLMDSIHTGLDIVGLVPGLGEIADGINALTYLAEGDYTNAALSTAAMVPFAGYAANAVKFGKTANKVVDIYTATRNAKKYVGQSVNLSKRYSKEVAKQMKPQVVLSVPKRLANAVEQQMISVHGTRKFGNGLSDNARNQISLKNQVKNKETMQEAMEYLDNNLPGWMEW